MTDLYRLVSPDKLELYDLKKDGKLIFCQNINPSNFNFKKIRILILSAYFINWDTTRIENTAYQPHSTANLFASRSIFPEEELVITAPFRNISTGFWAQAWAPKDKLGLILKNISKQAKIYAESITVSASDSAIFWQSGPVVLNNSNETGFTARHSLEVISGKVVENLDGFNFIAQAAFNLFKEKKPYALIFAGLALLASVTFAWEHSIKKVLKNNLETAVSFDNRLLGIGLVDTIQNFVPDGATEKVTFDQRTQETSLTFTSEAKAKKFFNSVSTSSDSIGGWSVSIKDLTVIFVRNGS